MRARCCLLLACATLTVLAACRDQTTGDTNGGGGTGACNGVTCAADQFCERFSCGEGQDECTPRPASCTSDGPRVCGDDGVVYASTCAAAKAGHSTGDGCTAPAGTFACGAYFCEPSSEYCQTTESSCGPALLQCQPYPEFCTTVPPSDCSCLIGSVACSAGNTIDSTCTQMGDQFGVYCPQ
jgi:Kazal-type serine protease inhibitor domain